MKVTLSALLAFVAAASALVLDAPNNWHANERVTERWQEQDGDPAQFDLQLAAANNNKNSNRNWDVANNVRTANEQVSFQVPNVPAGRYYLRAVDTNNQNKVYAQTARFNIASGNGN